MSIPPWIPKEGVPDSVHLRDLSYWCARNLPQLVAAVTGGRYAPTAGNLTLNQAPPATAEDAVSEDQIAFDDEAGHTHEGTDGTGTPIPLSGDVTGDNTATVVEQVQGVPFPAPGSGDDGKVLAYDHGGLTYEWLAVLTAAAKSRQTVDGFYANAVAASVTAQVLTRNGAAGPQAHLPVQSGSVTGVAVYSDAAVAAGTLTVEVFVNGVGTGLTAELNTTDTQLKIATQAAGIDTFVGGDRIDIRFTTNPAFLPITANIIASLEITHVLDP